MLLDLLAKALIAASDRPQALTLPGGIPVLGNSPGNSL
jgi:hypothetical protein